MQRFTDDAQRVLSLAQEAALELGHDYVGTEHVLIGLTKVKNSVAAKALEELGIVTENIFEAVEDHVGRGNKKATSIYMTPRVKYILELAVQGFNVPKFSVVTNKYFREVILDEIKEYNRKEGNEDEISDWNSIFDKNTERKIENMEYDEVSDLYICKNLSYVIFS